VAQHLPQSAVLIGKFVDAVVVSVQAQAQNSEHENAPLIHPRSAGAGIGLTLSLHTIRQHFAQYREHALPKDGLGVDVLQPAQNLRNVVS
jgi:hypothetical protein